MKKIISFFGRFNTVKYFVQKRNSSPGFVVSYLLFVICLPVLARAAPVIIPNCGKDGNCGFADLITLGNNIVNFLLTYFAGPFAVLIFMWAGFLFMFKSSSSGDVSKAKGMFWNVVWGFVIALGAFLIVKLILTGLEVGSGYYSGILKG